MAADKPIDLTEPTVRYLDELRAAGLLSENAQKEISAFTHGCGDGALIQNSVAELLLMGLQVFRDEHGLTEGWADDHSVE